MIRLFSAFFPSEPAREHLVRALRPIHAVSGNELRWTDPDNWHLTLAFYGDQPNDAAAVRAHLAAVAAGHGAMDLHVAGAGSFDRRTLWAGVGGDTRELAELMADCALPDDRDPRRSRAHLTVARASRRFKDAWQLDDHVRALSVYRGPDFLADELCLVRSYLGEGRGGGPRYEVVDRYYLR